MQASGTSLTVVQPAADQLSIEGEPLRRVEPEAQGPLTGRASRHASWKSVFAIGAIMLLCFGLVVGAPVPLDQRQVSHEPANCSMMPRFNPMIQRSYLPHGIVHFDPTPHEREATRLREELQFEQKYHPRWALEERTREINEAQAEACYHAARDYLQLADAQEHPADQAVALQRARGHLIKANDLVPHRVERATIEQVLLAEAQACSDAAKSAETPAEKLSWIFRAIREINLIVDMTERTIPCLYSDHKGPCYAAADLWEDAGDIFMTCPSLNVADFFFFDSDVFLITNSNEEAAAISYSRAGYFMRAGAFTSIDWRSMSSELYLKAYQAYKKINFAQCTLEQQAHLLEEIVSLSFRIWMWSEKLGKEEVFQEIMTAQSIYEEAAKVTEWKRNHLLIMQASHLESAAKFAATAEDSLELLQRARDILESEWTHHPTDCLMDRVFMHPKVGRGQFVPSRSSFDDSLLALLRKKVTDAENKLKQSDDGSILGAITSLFSKKKA